MRLGLVAGALAALTLAVSAPAGAVKWVSGSELIGHCQAYVDAPTSLDGVVCVAYIQGFLGGAEATDAEVENSVRAEYPERSDYMKRVVRTRVSASRIELFGATALANYCLPLAEPTSRVVANVVAYIESHPEQESLNAQEIVYGALQEYYPCAD